tara:strand:- start:1538 stop:2410 length:873 start_codon:yes stop_codon:yes gene_type:complete
MFIGSAIATGSYSSMVAGTPADTAYTPLLLDNPHSVSFAANNYFRAYPAPYSIPTDNYNFTMGGWFKNKNVAVATAQLNMMRVLPFSVEMNGFFQYGPTGMGLQLTTFAGSQSFQTHTIADVGFDPNNPTWNHVLMSFESQTRVKLFLNGVKIIDEPTTKEALTAMPIFNIFTADYRIGQGGMEFNYVATWERCLTEDECVELYNGNCMVDPRDTNLTSSNDLSDLWLMGGGTTATGAPADDFAGWTGVVPNSTMIVRSTVSPIHRGIQSHNGILLADDPRLTNQPTCTP